MIFPPTKRSLNTIQASHLQVITSALGNVLATEIAIHTFAQIIDGVPLSTEAREASRKIAPYHPIHNHSVLCPGVVEKAKEIHRDFDLAVLKFNPQLLQAFEASSIGSRAFNLRLIEITAEALHQIAVYLHSQRIRLHDSTTTKGLDIEGLTTWERPPDIWERSIPHPTLFTNRNFIYSHQYPDGVADMVGYWAEDRILGGVAIFDRSNKWEENGLFEPNVYFQVGRVYLTHRICQMLDTQQKELVRFLLSEPDKAIAICPLPILVSGENKTRVDPADAMMLYIYRDPWEREGPSYSHPAQVEAPRRARDTFDYPEEEDTDALLKRLNAQWDADQRLRRQ